MANTEKKDIVIENIDKINELAAKGLTISEIAKSIGVSRSTLYKYRKQSTELKDAIKKGRASCVETIENAMYNSAVGYTRKIKKYQKLKRILYDENTGKKSSEYEEMVEYEEEVYYPPDNTAGIFLLKNWGSYANEPVTNELRKKEIALKEKQVNANLW